MPDVVLAAMRGAGCPGDVGTLGADARLHSTYLSCWRAERSRRLDIARGGGGEVFSRTPRSGRAVSQAGTRPAWSVGSKSITVARFPFKPRAHVVLREVR